MTIQDWIDKRASLPNRGPRRAIRAYATSGMRDRGDEVDVVYGPERERVTCPLFGSPMAIKKEDL